MRPESTCIMDCWKIAGGICETKRHSYKFKQRLHRISQCIADKLHTIIIRLSYFKQRELNLSRAKTWKPRGVFINQDFSWKVSHTSKDFYPRLQAILKQPTRRTFSFHRPCLQLGLQYYQLEMNTLFWSLYPWEPHNLSTELTLGSRSPGMQYTTTLISQVCKWFFV